MKLVDRREVSLQSSWQRWVGTGNYLFGLFWDFVCMILEETFSGKKVFNGTAPVRQQWCESNAASCFPDSEWRQPGLFVCLPFLADHPGHLAHPDPTV